MHSSITKILQVFKRVKFVALWSPTRPFRATGQQRICCLNVYSNDESIFVLFNLSFPFSIIQFTYKYKSECEENVFLVSNEICWITLTDTN
jgi:hypothetical protein